MIKEILNWMVNICWNTLYFACSYSILPIYSTVMRMIQFCIEMPRRQVHYLMRESFISDLIKYFIGLVHELNGKIRSKIASIRSFFGFNKQQERVTSNLPPQTTTSIPFQIIESQKVLMLMQKMTKLEETITQQSLSKQKAQQELSQLKIHFQQKREALIKEQNQKIQKAIKLRTLKTELQEKLRQIERYKQYEVKLQKQLQHTKQRLVSEEKEKIIQPQQFLNEEHIMPINV